MHRNQDRRLEDGLEGRQRSPRHHNYRYGRKWRRDGRSEGDDDDRIQHFRRQRLRNFRANGYRRNHRIRQLDDRNGNGRRRGKILERLKKNGLDYYSNSVWDRNVFLQRMRNILSEGDELRKTVDWREHEGRFDALSWYHLRRDNRAAYHQISDWRRIGNNRLQPGSFLPPYCVIHKRILQRRRVVQHAVKRLLHTRISRGTWRELRDLTPLRVSVSHSAHAFGIHSTRERLAWCTVPERTHPDMERFPRDEGQFAIHIELLYSRGMCCAQYS